jgi:predicted histidine transporter YuiF (NhaC family)
MFFFKVITGIASISQNILPERIAPIRVTISANVNAISFRQRKHKTIAYSCSFFLRTTRTWDSPGAFKA